MRLKPPMLVSFIKIRQAQAACFLLLVLLASATSVVAIPLSVYRERVHNCVIKLDSLQSIEEDTDENAREEFITQSLEDVRRLLPPTEMVDSGGHSLEIDNKWLEAALIEYELLYGSSKERRALLTETTERLVALEEALAELDTRASKTDGTLTTEEAKSKLSNILLRDEFAKKSAEGNALTRLWRRLMGWLRGIFPKSPQMAPSRAGFLSQIAQIIVVGLALAAIAFVAWKLWPRIWRSSARGKKIGKREARVVLGERLEADQSSEDLLAEAEALARDGNLRAAIRKGYVAFLCELGDRKVLGLAQHKTNRDYLRSVQNQEQLYREMQFLTNSFENHWYGFVTANTNDWNMFRAHYHQALNQ